MSKLFEDRRSEIESYWYGRCDEKVMKRLIGRNLGGKPIDWVSWRNNLRHECRRWGLNDWSNYQLWLIENRLWPTAVSLNSSCPYYSWPMASLPPGIARTLLAVRDTRIEVEKGRFGFFYGLLTADRHLYPYYLYEGASDVEIALLGDDMLVTY